MSSNEYPKVLESACLPRAALSCCGTGDREGICSRTQVQDKKHSCCPSSMAVTQGAAQQHGQGRSSEGSYADLFFSATQSRQHSPSDTSQAGDGRQDKLSSDAGQARGGKIAHALVHCAPEALARTLVRVT